MFILDDFEREKLYPRRKLIATINRKWNKNIGDRSLRLFILNESNICCNI